MPKRRCLPSSKKRGPSCRHPGPYRLGFVRALEDRFGRGSPLVAIICQYTCTIYRRPAGKMYLCRVLKELMVHQLQGEVRPAWLIACCVSFRTVRPVVNEWMNHPDVRGWCISHQVCKHSGTWWHRMPPFGEGGINCWPCWKERVDDAVANGRMSISQYHRQLHYAGYNWYVDDPPHYGASIPFRLH